MPNHNPDMAVVVTGESLAAALEEADVSANQSVQYAGTIYDPVPPGCVACQFERDEAGDDPLDAPAGEGVYAWRENHESRFYCTGCEREVIQKIDAVELLTDRRGPDDSETNRLLLDRIFGYFPTDVEITRELDAFARTQWVENARAILAYAGLIDGGDNGLKLENGDGEFV